MESKKFFIIIALGVIFLGAVLFNQKKQSDKDIVKNEIPAEFEEKSDEGQGEVTISARPYFETLDKKQDLIIDVALNTHSVDLTGFDVLKNTKLVMGTKTIAPDEWAEKTGSEHHRSGKLVFNNLDLDAAEFSLIVLGLGEVKERVISWNL